MVLNFSFIKIEREKKYTLNFVLVQEILLSKLKSFLTWFGLGWWILQRGRCWFATNRRCYRETRRSILCLDTRTGQQHPQNRSRSELKKS